MHRLYSNLACAFELRVNHPLGNLRRKTERGRNGSRQRDVKRLASDVKEREIFAGGEERRDYNYMDRLGCGDMERDR